MKTRTVFHRLFDRPVICSECGRKFYCPRNHSNISLRDCTIATVCYCDNCSRLQCGTEYDQS